MTSPSTNKIIINKQDTNEPLLRSKPQNQKKENKMALKIVWAVKGPCKRKLKNKLTFLLFKFLFFKVFLAVLAIYSLISIAKIIIGIRSLGKCVIQSHIPIWLIAFGAASLFPALIKILDICLKLLDKQNYFLRYIALYKKILLFSVCLICWLGMLIYGLCLILNLISIWKFKIKLNY
jgi:hypothetical protein